MVSISVVIPTYNRCEIVTRAIDSALQQRYEDYEVIVVDDGSDDGTISILREYERKYDKFHLFIHSENQGANAARNTGIKNACHEYISFLDSDDKLHPTHLKRVADVFNRLSSEYVGVYTSFEYESEKGKKRIVNVPSNVVMSDVLKHNPIGGFSAITIRKQPLYEVGLLDESLPAYQDRDLYIRLLEKYKLWGINEVLLLYNLQEDSISNTPGKKIQAINMLRKKHSDKLTTEHLAHFKYTKGFTYADHGLMSEAAAEFRSSIQMYPRNPLYYYHYIAARLGEVPFNHSVRIKEFVKKFN